MFFGMGMVERWCVMECTNQDCYNPICGAAKPFCETCSQYERTITRDGKYIDALLGALRDLGVNPNGLTFRERYLTKLSK